MNKEFIILSKSKLLINKIDDLLENVPRKDMFYKDKIKEYTLNLIDNIMHINNEYYNKDLILFNNISSNLMMIDLLLERLLVKQYISEKSLIKVSSILVEIRKMTISWSKHIINE